MAEQLIRNEQVVSSILTSSSKTPVNFLFTGVLTMKFLLYFCAVFQRFPQHQIPGNNHHERKPDKEVNSEPRELVPAGIGNTEVDECKYRKDNRRCREREGFEIRVKRLPKFLFDDVAVEQNGKNDKGRYCKDRNRYAHRNARFTEYPVLVQSARNGSDDARAEGSRAENNKEVDVGDPLISADIGQFFADFRTFAAAFFILNNKNSGNRKPREEAGEIFPVSPGVIFEPLGRCKGVQVIAAAAEDMEYVGGEDRYGKRGADKEHQFSRQFIL